MYVSPELKQFSWQGLYDLIKGRKTSPKEGSYTTYLFEKGKEKILKKVGEECTEVIIAGEKEDKAETVYEISDLAYHVLVLMVQAGITVEDITRELENDTLSTTRSNRKGCSDSLWQIIRSPVSIVTRRCATAKTPYRRWPPLRVRRG